MSILNEDFRWSVANGQCIRVLEDSWISALSLVMDIVITDALIVDSKTKQTFHNIYSDMRYCQAWHSIPPLISGISSRRIVYGLLWIICPFRYWKTRGSLNYHWWKILQGLMHRLLIRGPKSLSSWHLFGHGILPGLELYSIPYW